MRTFEYYKRAVVQEMFERLGVFFACTSEHFNFFKVPGVQYEHIGELWFCPVYNIDTLIKEYDTVYAKSIALDMQENRKEVIINRELYQSGALFTGDISCVVDFLEQYGITEDEIREVYTKESLTIGL